MAIDNKTVQDIARLARLRINESESKQYANELSDILDLVAQMKTVDTDHIEPMTHPFDATLRMRDDQVSESNQRDHFQTVAPKTDRGLYLVPKVID